MQTEKCNKTLAADAPSVDQSVAGHAEEAVGARGGWRCLRLGLPAAYPPLSAAEDAHPIISLNILVNLASLWSWSWSARVYSPGSIETSIVGRSDESLKLGGWHLVAVDRFSALISEPENYRLWVILFFYESLTGCVELVN